MSIENSVASFDEFALKHAEAFQAGPEAAELLASTGAFSVASIVAGGKGTIGAILTSEGYSEVVKSHTTRDIEHRDRRNPENPHSYPDAYHFVDMPHMLGKILASEMLEVAPVHGGDIYGTSLDELRRVSAVGKRPMLEIDIQGVRKLQAVYPELPAFFITPTTLPGWLERWAGRSPETSEEVFGARVVSALAECEAVLDMAYQEQNTITLISNVEAQVASDSIVVALEEGTVANQPARLLALRDFKDSLKVEVESNTGRLWEDFQLLTKQA